VSDSLRDQLLRASALKDDLSSILGKVEGSRYAAASVQKTATKLESLSLDQEALFREAIACLGHKTFRAAMVLAWAALMDYIHDIIASDDLVTVKNHHSAWKIRQKHDLRDQSDFQVIDFLRVSGFINKTDGKALHGMLNTRNEAAHPGDIKFGHTKALAYIKKGGSGIRTTFVIFSQ